MANPFIRRLNSSLALCIVQKLKVSVTFGTCIRMGYTFLLGTIPSPSFYCNQRLTHAVQAVEHPSVQLGSEQLHKKQRHCLKYLNWLALPASAFKHVYCTAHVKAWTGRVIFA